MIRIKNFYTHIAAILEPLKPRCSIGTAFPQTAAEFPKLTVTETVNSAALVLEGRERLSYIVFQLDIWDNSPDRQTAEEISERADELMQGAGFKRTSGFTADEKNLYRKVLRYAGTVDLVNFKVYAK